MSDEPRARRGTMRLAVDKVKEQPLLAILLVAVGATGGGGTATIFGGDTKALIVKQDDMAEKQDALAENQDETRAAFQAFREDANQKHTQVLGMLERVVDKFEDHDRRVQLLEATVREHERSGAHHGAELRLQELRRRVDKLEGK